MAGRGSWPQTSMTTNVEASVAVGDTEAIVRVDYLLEVEGSNARELYLLFDGGWPICPRETIS